MDPASASSTAMGAALMRAVHTGLDDAPLIDDPWADRLIPAEEREAMRTRLGVEDLDTALRAHPAYGAVILRARYAEDVLSEAVGSGVRQYVLIGAGMDSFALRRPSFSSRPRDLRGRSSRDADVQAPVGFVPAEHRRRRACTSCPPIWARRDWTWRFRARRFARTRPASSPGRG